MILDLHNKSGINQELLILRIYAAIRFIHWPGIYVLNSSILYQTVFARDIA